MSEYTRRLKPDQTCEVHIFDVETKRDDVIYSSQDVLFEAPNWAKNGNLYLNGDGLLWSLEAVAGSQPVHIPVPNIPHLNNDHVLAPDHQSIFMSTFDDFQIHQVQLAGGTATQVTATGNGRFHFLHGVTPDGTKLAYVCLGIDAEGNLTPGYLRQLDLKTGHDEALTDHHGPDDGSEYDTSGEWIYFNTERFSGKTGNAQIARIRPDGSELTQLTFDDRVNWFPHVSPDGAFWTYLSYPPGTKGHPEDLEVQLKLVKQNDWTNAETLVTLPGGQGTINVNSWSPDSKKFAYVSYPFQGE